MAVIRTALPGEAPSGPVAGVLFRRTRTLAVVGPIIRRLRRTSPAQQRHRSAVSALHRAWLALPDATRQLWVTWANDYDAAAGDDADTAPAARERFLAINIARQATDLPSLDAPANPGVGNAEFPPLDIFPDTEADELRVKQLVPMLLTDTAPLRVVYSLGPAQRRTRRSNPRSPSPVGFYDPNAGEPGFTAPEIVQALPATTIPSPRYWGYSRLLAGDGNLSTPGVWPLETVGPGQTWALRIRPLFDAITEQSVQRRPGDELVIAFKVAGIPFEDVIDLTAGGSDTIGELATTIDGLGLWEVVDLNAANSSRDSVDIPEDIPNRKTINTQPALLTVSI